MSQGKRSGIVKVSLRQVNDGISVIDLEGDFDLYSSPKAREILLKLAKEKAPAVVVNLSKVGYMDSSGIATLIEALRALGKYGGKLILAGVNLKTMEVIKLARLEKIFDIKENEEQALASTKSQTQQV
ncbi:MAG: anti-sigma factor antagonist [Deltaproteobacteria bacterium]|nr:MAG: anti-sigma factor antagonist [Deltaproteobacteria bacterium]RLB10183.1 MAG: anti-sigma factor antagonist [Deltaproteobacteria bacterium]HEC31995.1 anti-sigma factor antagonist [Deltaproteobacteria bacterium]